MFSLVKAEAKLKNIKEDSLNLQLPHCDSSIIEVLQLWQKLFRETFQHYHRLSSQLVKTENSATALRLWREYLEYVQLFISDDIPDDYSSLKEHLYLCEIHKNLLSSQQTMFAKYESKETVNSHNMTTSIVEEFKLLTHLHQESLNNLLSRHSEIKNRLISWKQYRNDQKEVLDNLQELEKQRYRLNLRYLHLRNIPRVIKRIDDILERLKSIDKHSNNLSQQQQSLLYFCDDSLTNSINQEQYAINQRISNLRASLETWIGFLNKVTKIEKEHENEVKEIQRTFLEIQMIINTSIQNVTSNPKTIQQNLDLLYIQKNRNHMIRFNLENINELQNKLKDYVSPYDMKKIKQMSWLSCEQQADLEQQLICLISQMEEDLSKYKEFIQRFNKLSEWFTKIESRVNKKLNINLQQPDEVNNYFDYVIQPEINIQEKEKDWIMATGEEFLSQSSNENDIQVNIQQKMKNIEERWKRLVNIIKSRFNKIKDFIMTISQLNLRIINLRSWLYQIEIELAKPLTFEDTTTNTIETLLKHHEGIQKSIESESSNIGEVLNFCDILLSDIDNWNIFINILTITTAIELLESRWKKVCEISNERKKKILHIWNLIQELMQIEVSHRQWVSDKSEMLKQIQSTIPLLTKVEIKETIETLKIEVQTIEQNEKNLTHFNDTYGHLVRTNGMNSNKIKELSIIRDTLTKWNQLLPFSVEFLNNLHKTLKIYKEFVSAHERAIIKLTQFDVQLTNLEHLNNEDETTKQILDIRNFSNEFQNVGEYLEEADKLGLLVMEKSKEDENEVQTIQILIDEYQGLYKDIINRLEALKVRYNITENIIDESVQVETLKFEKEAAVQVNTLNKTYITQKDAYTYELYSALKETVQNIDLFENAIKNPAMKPGTQGLIKIISNCQSSVELIQHLSNLLITSCDCSQEEAAANKVREQIERYNGLRAIYKAKEVQYQKLR